MMIFSSFKESNFKVAAALIKIVTFIIAVFLSIISRYALIFFSAAMLPTIVAVFLDRYQHRCASATVCTFNLIGAMPYLAQLWQSSSINTAAQLIIANVDTWMMIYGAAFVGQLLYMSVPLLIVKWYASKAQVMASDCRDKCKKLCHDWGINIKDYS